MKIAAIVLAAGRGSRMGTDKMRLDWQGRPLPVWPVMAAVDAGLDPVIVVVAPGHDDLAACLSGHGAQAVINPAPDAGMAGSIGCGIAALPPDIEAAAILLGDMPLISAELLRALADALVTAQGVTIVAPVHDGKRGNPVLFHRTHFTELMELRGDTGARDLLARYRSSTDLVPAGAEVGVDMDIPSDLIQVNR
jgi:molybdenum cofactor cytidylyltransferase